MKENEQADFSVVVKPDDNWTDQVIVKITML